MRARLFAAALLGLALAPVLGAAPASGHDDTIAFAITPDDAGRVTATATWAEDRHPVEDPVVATLVATSADGERIGPLRLHAVDGRVGVLALEDPLPAGTWTLVAESSIPALGRGEAVADVKPVVQGPRTASAGAVFEPLGGRPAPEPSWVVAAAEVAVIASLTALLSFGVLWMWRRRRA